MYPAGSMCVAQQCLVPGAVCGTVRPAQCGSPPGSWLGLCMEEVAGHGFLCSLILERVAAVGGAGGPHPRVLEAAW